MTKEGWLSKYDKLLRTGYWLLVLYRLLFVIAQLLTGHAAAIVAPAGRAENIS